MKLNTSNRLKYEKKPIHTIIGKLHEMYYFEYQIIENGLVEVIHISEPIYETSHKAACAGRTILSNIRKRLK